MSVPSGPDVAALVEKRRSEARQCRASGALVIATWMEEDVDALEAVEQERARLSGVLRVVKARTKYQSSILAKDIADLVDAALSPEGNHARRT